MSIANEIKRLQNAKSTLKTKLNAKNDEQHQITNETIDEYGDFVDSIQSSNIIGATAEGESLSLTNTKAMPYSDYVVEGKSTQATRSGKNLLNVTATTRTMNGVTITVNQDKSITLNGTNTSSETIFYRLADNFNLPAGTYTLSNHNNNVSNNNFIFYDDNYNFEERYNVVTKTFNTQKTIKPYLKVAAGITLNNEIIYPMIEKNSFMTDYEPYGASPSPEYPSEIHSVADDVNLFDVSNYTITYGGAIGFDVSNFEIGKQYTFSSNLPITDFKISNYSSGYNSVNNYVYNGFTNFTFTMARNSNIPSSETQHLFIALNLTNFITDINDITNYNIKVQKGSTPTSYSPYNQGTVTIKQRGTTESNDFIFQTSPLRSLPNGVKDTIEAEQHRKIGRQTGTLTETTTITLSDAKTNGAYMCNIKPSGTLTGKTIELEAGDYEIIYELAEEVIEPLTQNQATTMLDIIKTGSYEGTTNIYTDEDVKPTIGVGYYKKS